MAASAVMQAYTQIPIGDGSDAFFLVRCPDRLTLIANGWLPLPLVYAVSQSIATDRPQWVIDSEVDRAQAEREFVDRWVCASVVCPRVSADATALTSDGNELHISELAPSLRRAIFEATYLPLLRRMRQRAAEIEEFVCSSDEALGLAAFGRAFGQRPSVVAGVVDDELAVDFDLALSLRLATLSPEPPHRI